MSSRLISKIFQENTFNKFSLLLIRSYSGSSHRVVFQPRPVVLSEHELSTQQGRNHAINKLVELLGVKKIVAIDMVMKHKKFTETTVGDLVKNYTNLKKEIKNETITKFPQLLLQPDLLRKFEILKKFPGEADAKAPLALLKLQELESMVKNDEKLYAAKLRIDVFCKMLQIDKYELYVAFVQRPFLKKISLKKLEENIKILTESGITPEEITKDWWVLCYSPKLIEARIQQAKENNIDKIKTWMVRGQSDILESYIKRRSENKSILGDSTLVEYLSERLECPHVEVVGLLNKLPALQNKSMKLLQGVIDFLYQEGFKPYHICRVPKILLHSVDTIKKRLRELEKLGIKLDSVHLLTKSQRQYMQYYEALVKSGKTKIKKTATV